MTLTRNLDTPENREYWAFVDQVATEVRSWPAWKRGETMQDINRVIAEIREKAAKATPRPWKWTPQECEQDIDGKLYPYTGANIPKVFTFDTGDGFNALDDTHAEFITLAANHVLEIADAYERAVADGAALRDAIKKLAGCMEDRIFIYGPAGEQWTDFEPDDGDYETIDFAKLLALPDLGAPIRAELEAARKVIEATTHSCDDTDAARARAYLAAYPRGGEKKGDG